MATQTVIANKDQILIDDSFLINWSDKGNSMPNLLDTIHVIVWNNLAGQNEIQYKNSSTGNMTTNVDLTDASDSVGSTTIQALLDWSETRKNQIEQAQTNYADAVAADELNETTDAVGKTWADYDPNYS